VRAAIGPIGWFEYGEDVFSRGSAAPVQGTAADILKLAMAHLWESREEYPDALPILTVHKVVVLECDAEAAPEVATWLSATLRGRSPTCSGTRS
jgi:DNA polymerase-1